MTNLDDKLREILEHWDLPTDPDCQTEAIAQIKQAFTDEGWEPHTTKLQRLHQHLKELEDYWRENHITPEEFYSRFEKELKIKGSSSLTKMSEVKAAARKAAGL